VTRYRSRTIWAAILAATAALAASCGGGEQRSVEATPTVEATQIVTSTSTTRDTTVGSPASTTSAGGSSPSSTRAPTTTTSTAAPLQLGIQRIALPQDGRLEVAAIASSGEVHIAAGAIGYSGLTNAAILRSTDSINWERIPHVDSLFGAGVEDFAQAKAIEDVIWTGELFVAAGWERDADRKTDAAVWTSVDGTTWTAVANLGQFGGADLQRIEALVWADGIGIVAIGNDTLGQGSGGATWISVDGTEWERVDPDLAFPRRSGQAGFEDIAWSGDKFVAVGREIWTSSDGRVWEEVVGFQADFADFWDIQAVAYSTSVGFIAAGHAGDEADAYNEAIWRSDDGVAWELLPSPSAVDGSFNKRQIFDIAETYSGADMDLTRRRHLDAVRREQRVLEPSRVDDRSDVDRQRRRNHGARRIHRPVASRTIDRVTVRRGNTDNGRRHRNSNRATSRLSRIHRRSHPSVERAVGRASRRRSDRERPQAVGLATNRRLDREHARRRRTCLHGSVR